MLTLALFFSLNIQSQMVFLVWAAIGLVFYFLYGYRYSNVARGITEVPELDADAPASVGIGPMPGAPEPGSREERD